MKLKQEQTEAIIRLMLLAIYQDKKVTLAEGDDFHKRIYTLPWESGETIDLFVNRATAQVRNIKDDPTERSNFLKDQAALLEDADVNHYAIKQISALLQSDGITSDETDFMKELQRYFK